jgi:acetyl esterase/lipase
MRLSASVPVRVALVALTVGFSGCGNFAFGVANLPAAFGDYDRRADLAYGEAPRQRLDVYVPPAAADSPRPVVVFFYGGAWIKGSKDDYRFVGAALADAGYVTVLPDYRLSPDVRFPEFVHDGARAVAWVQANSAQFGGDPARIFLMGHSAGAHLAALLAVDRSYLTSAGADPAGIRGLVGLSGPYALQPGPGDASLNRIFADPYGPGEWQATQRVTPGAPPALLLHGGADGVVSPRHSEAFAAALQAAGVDVQLEIYPDRRHADTVAALSVPARGRAPTLEDATRFIDARSGRSR